MTTNNSVGKEEIIIAQLENKYKEVFNRIWEDGKSNTDLMCAVELCVSESYSAAQPLQQLLSEKEKEIERLKGLIEKMYKENSPYTGNHLIVNYQKFKTENNL